MKLKLIVIAVLIILSHVSRGNMASPIREGSYAASAFSSKDVDILSESILIQIDADFKTARYIIEYTIRSDSANKFLCFFMQWTIKTAFPFGLMMNKWRLKMISLLTRNTFGEQQIKEMM